MSLLQVSCASYGVREILAIVSYLPKAYTLAYLPSADLSGLEGRSSLLIPK